MGLDPLGELLALHRTARHGKNDTLLLVHPLNIPFDAQTEGKMLDFYTAHTSKFGPAMTASIHAVVAARLGGLSHARILLRHIGPNVLSQAIIYAMSDIVMDIMAIVTLGYLGLGIAPPTAEWGSIISDGQEFITTQWQQATIPGLAVVVTSLGLSWLGDGLSDLLSPERRK